MLSTMLLMAALTTSGASYNQDFGDWKVSHFPNGLVIAETNSSDAQLQIGCTNGKNCYMSLAGDNACETSPAGVLISIDFEIYGEDGNSVFYSECEQGKTVARDKTGTRSVDIGGDIKMGTLSYLGQKGQGEGDQFSVRSYLPYKYDEAKVYTFSQKGAHEALDQLIATPNNFNLTSGNSTTHF
ncbi:hypothetical protein D5018_13845 [Parashewanella curva]|uniref:Uncharacterized protein n=1 Tax=Parashewanella curva TaxID=2338552 RepID=A0A3L8PWB2_9GAMM|nr:hypothetical protein [Parashewanella curva]RLV59089.1 hypothetical protein D5018_13845 [Parashewanella curva]